MKPDSMPVPWRRVRQDRIRRGERKGEVGSCGAAGGGGSGFARRYGDGLLQPHGRERFPAVCALLPMAISRELDRVGRTDAVRGAGWVDRLMRAHVLCEAQGLVGLIARDSASSGVFQCVVLSKIAKTSRDQTWSTLWNVKT